MLSYFAMIWSPSDPLAEGTASEIRARLTRDRAAPAGRFAGRGFELFDLTHAIYDRNILALPVTPDPFGGAIFGALFDKAGNPVSSRDFAARGTTLSSRICGSRGDVLFKDYWGSYVGFLDCGDRFVIVRDPTASLPCFHTDQRGVTLVFSHLQNVTFIDRSAFSLNLGFLSKLLIYDKIQNGETGLREVRELLGGERLEITARGKRTHLAWDPRAIAGDVFAPDQDAAARHLLDTTRMVVNAQSSRFDTVHVSLSGGLDSAIVLACLTGAAGRRDVSARHYSLESGDLSEENYARSAATFAHLPLEIVRISPYKALPDVTAHPATARPYRSFIGDTPPLTGCFEPGVRAALFTGQGGDHLFLERRTPLVFADHVLAHGLTSGALSSLLLAARLSQQSIWHVLLACLPGLLTGRRDSVMESAIRHRQESVAASAHGRTSLDGVLPEWASAAKGLPPAKFLQVSSLPHMVQLADRATLPDGWAVVHPLISQPLMELCLHLPVSLLLANGESRGLARQAFDGVIPNAIRRRMTKGSASSYFMEFLEANADPLVDALRSGALIELGLMNRADLDTMTRPDNLGVRGLGRSLLIAYTIEAWLRTWTAIIGTPGKRA